MRYISNLSGYTITARVHDDWLAQSLKSTKDIYTFGALTLII